MSKFQPGDQVPSGGEGIDLGSTQAREHRRVQAAPFGVGVAGGAIARIHAAKAFGGLDVAPGKIVDGPYQHRATRRLHPLHQLLRVLPLGGHVELVPGWCAKGFGDFLDSGRCLGRKDL